METFLKRKLFNWRRYKHFKVLGMSLTLTTRSAAFKITLSADNKAALEIGQDLKKFFLSTKMSYPEALNLVD